MINWDYDLPKDWKPRTNGEWIWYLTRLVNYGLKGERIDVKILKKYFPYLKADPTKKAFLKFILEK